jgi:signal transduction histidine kinase
MEENRLSLEMNPFTVDAVMEESIEIVAVNAEKKKIPLTCDPDPSMPKLMIGDAVRLSM